MNMCDQHQHQHSPQQGFTLNMHLPSNETLATVLNRVRKREVVTIKAYIVGLRRR